MPWEWESSLWPACTLVATVPCPGSIPKPPFGAGCFWGQCGFHWDPNVRPNSKSAEFRALVVLSCYVVLGLAVGSLPFPGSLELQLTGWRGFNIPWARGNIPEKSESRAYKTKPNQLYIIWLTTKFYNHHQPIIWLRSSPDIWSESYMQGSQAMSFPL